MAYFKLLFRALFISLFLILHLNSAYPRPIKSEHGMVTSAHPDASAAGLRILQLGGNAVDSAVATAFAISVVEPFSAGIGGGGFLLLYLNKTKEIKSLDFREKAPKKASRDMYLDKKGKVVPNKSIDGHWSVAVPGTVAGLYEVHKKYGKLPWVNILRPAIKLAENGFVVGENFVKYYAFRENIIKQNPAALAIFSKKNKPYKIGDKLVQKNLAKTLELISQDPNIFYTGKIAKLIEEDMKAHGGLIRFDDLKNYKPTWRKPICGEFKNNKICSMPPPSSGGIALIEMLNMTELIPKPYIKWHNTNFLHYESEIMRTAYADRATHLGDPDFTDIPQDLLISKAYAKKRFAEIPKQKARLSKEIKAADYQSKYDAPNTSHLNTVDHEKNAVSMTFTVNYLFGSGVVATGTGILLNNEMDDFSAAPGVPNAYGLVGGKANEIQPGKIPLSSMSPMIALDNKNKLLFAAGTPGGSKIISTMFNFTINKLLFGMDVAAAIASPRLHNQWMPDILFIEDHGIDPATESILTNMGHKLKFRPPWSNANAIFIGERLEGTVDPRGEGSVAGL